MKEYNFIHQLHIYRDWVYDIAGRMEYDYKIDMPENSIIIEDPTDEGLDASFDLCVQFEKDGLMPDYIEDDDTDYGYGWFECYEQAKYDMDKPDERVSRAVGLLEDKGYLKAYSVHSLEFHPSIMRYKKDGSIDVVTLDPDYKNDPQLVDQIKEILQRPLKSAQT